MARERLQRPTLVTDQFGNQCRRHDSHESNRKSQCSWALSITSLWASELGSSYAPWWQQPPTRGFLWTRWVLSTFSRWWWFFTSTAEEYSTKAKNGGWIIHLEKEMIFFSIIELTIGVKITKNLRWRWIYQVLTVDYTFKIFSIGSILSKAFSTIWIFQKKIK